MSSRIIRQGEEQTLQDYLISMFAVELFQPSNEIYFMFPYLGNSPIADNCFSQYSALFPISHGSMIRMADILDVLAFKGTEVKIICNPEHEETRSLINRLNGKVHFKNLTDSYDQMIVSEKIYLQGSIKFTEEDININQDIIRVTNAPPEVSKALLTAREHWKESYDI